MPVRYYIGPLVDITLPHGTARGSACLRYWDGPPSRVSIVKVGGMCLARFDATLARLTEAEADTDLLMLPDRADLPDATTRGAIRARLAQLGVDSSALIGDGRAIVIELARRITGVRAGALRMGPDDVNGGTFGERIR